MEARLVEAESGGLVPEGAGWFVLNARGEQVEGSWTWPADPMAQRHGAGVASDTSAYAGVARRDRAFQEGWLPG